MAIVVLDPFKGLFDLFFVWICCLVEYNTRLNIAECTTLLSVTIWRYKKMITMQFS